jgi:hypothetical protein
MGGIGLSIDIKQAKLAEGKKRSTTLSLHKAVSTSIVNKIWTRCRYGAFRSTADMYLSEEKGDGYHEHLWEASDDDLSWSFMDHAGCCNGSSWACYHWFEVALHAYRESFDSMAAGKGYQITSPKKPNLVLLFSCDYPLFAAEKQPYCMTSFTLAKLDWEEDWNGPFWDDGSPRPKIADFSGEMLNAVTRCAITGLCECGVCYELRRGEEFTKGSDIQLLKDTWLKISSDKNLIEVAATVQKELMDYQETTKKYEGPPSLQELVNTLGKGAPSWWELAGICCQVVDRAKRNY